ncbi:probable global transcription activator SNF2L1 [Anopheles moucheti]|uniref:probable global transcription activator SNF2L1 n=1 Tax=Anopheles moucheti TaxID=186751 RepID=UPI0022F07766|nr:probable global transcription activator SNF2L1 [Anopheles moucheti]
MLSGKTSPPSPNIDEDKLERKVFREQLQRKRLMQLEALERKLAGFAEFNQAHLKKKPSADRGTTGRKQLASIENLRNADIANNNAIDGIDFMESPSYINGTMRDYQIRGLNWLISMYNSNLNGILADEMGLGKTIQSISMIGYLMSVRKLKGPFLVVVPLSTLFNWMNEFARFLPSAKVLKAHATGEQSKEILAKLSDRKRSWNVAVTTYEFVTFNKLHFKRINFHYAIIDEGHRARNENTVFASVLRTYQIQSMVLLTGTPVHNNLHELWALLNLLMPLFFSSADNFDSWFTVEDCVDPRNEQTIRLKNLLRPLLLRRTKLEVAPSIPPKVHIDIYVPPTEQMCLWTHKVVQNELQEVGRDGHIRRFRIGSRFPHLRKVIQHPYLVPGAENMDTDYVTDDIVNFSSKMILLDKLLARLKARGSKVLIFSQYVTVLKILMDYLDWREYEYCVLTGSTGHESRQSQMEEFNSPGSSKFVFLLSTRAGGLGINLVAADTVIFYDMDFNPQMDFQAEDRAHRIGQKRKVHVLRLLVRGSMDELLYHHSTRKRLLDAAVIRGTAKPDKKLETVAFEYQRTSLMANGLVDPVAIDKKVDELFDRMGNLDDPFATTDGLQEDGEIVVPGIPCDLQFNTLLNPAKISNKRKQEETVVPITAKRKRYSIHQSPLINQTSYV